MQLSTSKTQILLLWNYIWVKFYFN